MFDEIGITKLSVLIALTDRQNTLVELHGLVDLHYGLGILHEAFDELHYGLE